MTALEKCLNANAKLMEAFQENQIAMMELLKEERAKNDEWVTQQVAAELTSLSPSAISYRCVNGIFECKKVAGSTRYLIKRSSLFERPTEVKFATGSGKALDW